MITQRLKGITLIYQEKGFGAAVLKVVHSATKNLLLFFYKKWEEFVLCKVLMNPDVNLVHAHWQIKGLENNRKYCMNF